MTETRFPSTPATRFLSDHKVDWRGHVFPYVDKGGTKHSSAQLGVPEHQVIKTLVFEDETKRALIVLMHGDKMVSTKSIVPCKPEVAEKHTGYKVGGTSPFGTRKAIAVHAEATIFGLETIYINGGGRGFLVQMTPADLDRVLAPMQVDVAID